VKSLPTETPLVFQIVTEFLSPDSIRLYEALVDIHRDDPPVLDHAAGGQDPSFPQSGTGNPSISRKTRAAALLIAHPPTFATTQSWGHFHFATATPNLTADQDGDGTANLMEYLLGTKPTGQTPGDAAFLPKISTEPDGLGGKRWVFEFHQPATRTGASWVIKASADLSSNSWSTLAHSVNGVSIIRSGDNIRATGPIGAGSRFLRLHAVEN
jgi:hypothetical protein